MICSLSHYPLNLSTGGSVRALNVWKIFTRIYNDFLIAYALSSDSKRINLENMMEVHIRKPFLLRKVSGGYLCSFPRLIERQLSSSKIFEDLPFLVIFEGPYMGYAVLKTIGIPKSTKIIYDAHNIEVNYHRAYFKWNPLKTALLQKIESIERKVMNEADYVLSTSLEECKILEDKYRLSHEKVILVPNGVDSETIKPLDPRQRLQLKNKFQLKKPLIIFMGSRILANIVAGKWILEHLAKKVPEATFLILGSVCKELKGAPYNVKILGTLSNLEKNEMLQIADIAINPVQFGAGTNVKMLEYLSAGLPIVSTVIGTRGLHLTDRKEVLIGDLRDFHVHIHEVLHNESLRGMLSENSRRKAEEYDWKNIERTVKTKLI